MNPREDLDCEYQQDGRGFASYDKIVDPYPISIESVTLVWIESKQTNHLLDSKAVVHPA